MPSQFLLLFQSEIAMALGEGAINLCVANMNGDLYSLGKALGLFFVLIILYLNIHGDVLVLQPKALQSH